MTSTYTGSGAKVSQMQLQYGRLHQFCTINRPNADKGKARGGKNFQDISQTLFKYGPKSVCKGLSREKYEQLNSWLNGRLYEWLKFFLGSDTNSQLNKRVCI